MTAEFVELLTGSQVVPAVLDWGMIHPGMIVGQVLKWLPVWLTPIWVIAVGLGIGALACIAVYGVLALLSFLPGIGKVKFT